MTRKKSVRVQYRCDYCRPNYIVHVSNNITFSLRSFQPAVGLLGCRTRDPAPWIMRWCVFACLLWLMEIQTFLSPAWALKVFPSVPFRSSFSEFQGTLELYGLRQFPHTHVLVSTQLKAQGGNFRRPGQALQFPEASICTVVSALWILCTLTSLDLQLDLHSEWLSGSSWALSPCSLLRQ